MPKQIFKCWIEGYSDESNSTQVEAYDIEDAAEEACESYHASSAEYPTDTKVFVKDVGNGEVTKFSVTWEAVRNYYAEEVKPEAKA